MCGGKQRLPGAYSNSSRGRGWARGAPAHGPSNTASQAHQEDAQPNEHIDKRRGGVPVVKVVPVVTLKQRGRGGRGAGFGSGNWRGMGRGRGRGGSHDNHWKGKGSSTAVPSSSSSAINATAGIPTGPRGRVQVQETSPSASTGYSSGHPRAAPCQAPGSTSTSRPAAAVTSARDVERVDPSPHYPLSALDPSMAPSSSSLPSTVYMTRSLVDTSPAITGLTRPVPHPIPEPDAVPPPKKRKLNPSVMPALKSEVVDESTVLLRPASNKHVKDEPMDVDYFPHSVDVARSTSTSSSLPTLVKQEPMASSLRPEHIARQSTGPSPISAFTAPVPSSAPIPSREKKPAVKLESLSSPIPASSLPVEPPRRLVTQWCTRIPFSHNCRKTHPDWESNRRELFRKEWGKLESFGLKKTKLLMRPDGMVIEWTSPVPVWSDTYLPDMNSASNIANAISQASQANAANSFPVPPSSSPSQSSPATSPGLHIPIPPLSSRSSHSKLVADKDRNRSHSDNKRSSTPSISPTSTTFGGSAKGKEREDPPEVIYISSSPPPQSPPPSRARALTPPIPTGLPPTPISALPAVYANTNANGFGGSKLSSPSLLQTQAAPPRSQSKQRPIPLPKRKRSPMELQLRTPTPASSANSPIPTTVAASASGPALILPTSNHGQQTQQRQCQDAFRSLPTPLQTPTSTGAPSSSGERKDGSTSLGKGGTSWSQPPLTPKSLEPPDRRHIQVEEENESAAVRKEVEGYQDTTAEMDVDICAETSSGDRAEGTPSMLRQRKSFLISANEVIGEFGEVGYGVEVEVVDSHNIGEREDEVTGQEMIPHGSRVWTMGEPQTMKLVDQFVERFVCAFDADRSALERMYTEDSWFTYRVIRSRGTDTTTSTTTTTTESTTRRGPRDIVHTLRNTLLRGYRFSWNNVSAQLARDYVVLGAKAGGGILLNVHGEVRRDPESSSSLSSSSPPMRPVRVSQVFLLTGNRAPQSRLGPEKSQPGGLDWPPFEVISHQMVVQEGRLDCSDDAVLQLD